jgi:hypothetical protein
MPFPVEVYSTVFRHVPLRDLATLCKVSKTFQHEAERILYHFVDITHITGGERLMFWCHATAESPSRALSVHSLRFPGSFEISHPQSTHFSSLPVQQAIAKAFKAFINLDQLCILRSLVLDTPYHSPTLLPSTFDDCTFSLSALSGGLPGFAPEDVWRLLSKHPNIRYWVASDSFQPFISSMPHGVLPNVADVVFVRPKMVKYLIGRPIKRLFWLFQSLRHTRSEGMEAIASLELFKHTLTDLHYNHSGQQDSDWTYVDIIRSIATHAPNLKSLVIDMFHHVKPTVNSITSGLSKNRLSLSY